MKIRLLFVMLLSIMLSACGSIYETHYSYQPPNSQNGKQCIAHCFQIKHNCQTLCQLQDQDCRRQARQDAYDHYSQYQHYQTTHGMPVQKHLNDFDGSYAKCYHTCHCASDFNTCYAGCGGAITEQKECLDCELW